MDRDSMIAALRDAGADEDTINKALANLDADSGDQLNKALGDLREAFDREHADRDEDLAKSMDEAADIVEAVTQGADAVLAEFRAQNDAMAKGMVALIEEVRAYRADLSALRDDVAELGDGSQAIAKALDVPEAPRGLSGARPVPSPADEAPAPTGTPDLINKALVELANDETTGQRRGQLNTAINRLNAGHHPQQVASDFNLS
jgi:hypothetical protein